MNPISLILLNIIYRPIFNIIAILLAIFWWNLGIAIILLTLIVRLIILKPSMHANNMQKGMTDMQPRMKEIQERYKDDPQKLAEETMKLFKWNGSSSPLKWCLMVFVQMPVFIWLFYVIKDLAENHIDKSDIYSFLYPFIHNWIDNINHIFLWIDLFKHGGTAWIILAIIAWALMYVQIKLTMLNKPKTPSMPWMWSMVPWMPDMSKMMWYMNIFMVFMMSTFVLSMPAWIWFYIITTTLFTIIQYSIQYRELLKAEITLALSKKK